MENFKNKKILIVGIGRTGFSLLNFFLNFTQNIRVTDIRPIFDLNKAVKKLKKLSAPIEITFGEHKEQDFIEADVVVYGPSISPNLPQLEAARKAGKKVYSEFQLAHTLTKTPIIAVCGTFGRTTISHMIGNALKLDGKEVFIGGTTETPFIEIYNAPNRDKLNYVVVEVSAGQLRNLTNFKPVLTVFSNLDEHYPKNLFKSASEYVEVNLDLVKALSNSQILVANYHALFSNAFFKNSKAQTYWYSRKSFIENGLINEVQGTHFHDKRIHCNISSHTEFRVSKMRIVGQENRENLLAAITACKALDVSDKAIQTTIERFPGIPHRLEFLVEKNGVGFYNDSKSSTMPEMLKSIQSFKAPIILIAGGKDIEELDYSKFVKPILEYCRVLVLVGECKERLNRAMADHPQTFVVGSFEESVLLAYQKSRTGDVILLSPGNPATDVFRDYEERGNYFKKLVFQL